MAYTDIDDPSAYFGTTLWSGNNATPRTLSFTGNSDLQPDWVWTKKRDGADHNQVFDSVRGFGASKDLCSGQTFAQGSASNGTSAHGFISSAVTNGFVVTAGSSTALLENYSGKIYVGWGWKKAAVAGFDIVAYTGSSSAQSISHSLSAVPEMMITKNLSVSSQWQVYTKTIGNGKAIQLNGTGGADSSSSYYNSTTPTSSVFTVGTDSGTNGNGNSMIAYLFRSVKGYSKIGSYTGNGNADGAFIYTGFKPAYLLWRLTNASGYGAQTVDNKRNPQNVTNSLLFPYDTHVEYTNASENLDLLSNGFKFRNADRGRNGSGDTYIYMAFAENPFVTSTGVPATAR